MSKLNSNVVETLQAQNEVLQAKNEALQAKNEALALKTEVQDLKEREKLNNRTNWNKRANKAWKKETVSSYLAAGYTIPETAGLHMVSEQTIRNHAPKENKPKNPKK